MSDKRVERLKTLTTVDAPDLPEVVLTWLIRQQAQHANMQYARFLAGAKFTEQDVDDILTNAIDSHRHGGSDPMERLILGCTKDELRTVFQVTPAALLGLERADLRPSTPTTDRPAGLPQAERMARSLAHGLGGTANASYGA